MDEAHQQEIVEALKLKYPAAQLHSIGSEAGGVFVVHRHASAAERRIYRGLKEEGKQLDAQDSLMSCVVYPEKVEFKKLCDEAPFFVEIVENAILAASGIYLDAVRKKL